MSKAIAETTIASCVRSSTRPRAGKIAISSFATAAATTQGASRRTDIDHEHVPAESAQRADGLQACRRTSSSSGTIRPTPIASSRYVTNWTGGVPDAEHPGLKMPDALVMAITDESTGEMLPKAKFLAGFSLQDVGGPPINEKPDATGLFSDGRFLDFGALRSRSGRGWQLSEPGAEPASFPVGQRRWRARVCGGNHRGVLYPQLRRRGAPQRRGAGGRHGRAAISGRRLCRPTAV